MAFNDALEIAKKKKEEKVRKEQDSNDRWKRILSTAQRKYTQDVDDKYIQSYLTDSQNYFTQAQRDYEGLNWTTGSDKSKYDARKDSASDLQGRSRKIRAYLNVNKDSVAKETYNDLLGYLDSTDSMYTSSLQDFDDAYKFYSQWESEDLYMRDNAFYEKYGKLSQNEDYQEKSSARDLGNVSAYDYVKKSVDYGGGMYYDKDTGKMVELRPTGYNRDKFNPGEITDKLGFYLEYMSLPGHRLEIQGEDFFDIIHEGDGSAWQQMSDEQIADYYYLYNTQGQAAAYEYLDEIDDVLRRDRYLAERGATIEEFKNASGLEKLWMNIKSVPAQWAANVTTNLERARQKITGDEWKPYTGLQYASNIRQLQAEELDKKYGNIIPGIDFSVGDAYQATMSGADSTFNALMSGGWAIGSIGGKAARTLGSLITSSTMGGGAYAAEAQRLYEQGATQEQIVQGATAAATIETLTEMLPLDNMLKVKDGKTILKFFKNAAVQSGLEGAEEVLSGIGNTFANHLIMKDESDLSRMIEENGGWWGAGKELLRQSVHDFIGGALAGGISGNVGAIGPTVAYGINQRNNGAVIRRNGYTGPMTEIANEMAENADSRTAKQLKRQAARVGKHATNNRVGKLYNTMTEASRAQTQKNASAKLVQEGFSQRKANAIAEAMVRQANNEQLTDDQESLLKKVENKPAVQKIFEEVVQTPGNEAVQQLVQNRYAGNLRSTLLQQGVSEAEADAMVETFTRKDGTEGMTATVARQLVQQGVTPETAAQLAEMAVQGTVSQQAEVVQERGSPTVPVTAQEQVQSAEGQVLYNDAPVQVASVKSAGNGQLIVQLADGAAVDASELSFPSRGEQLLYQVVGKIADSTETANKLLQGVQNGKASASVYAKAIEQAFFYGRHKIPLQQLLDESPYAQALTAEQLNQAYNLGKEAGPKNTNREQNRVDDTYNKAKKVLGDQQEKAPRTYTARAAEGVKVKKFRPQQKASYQLMQNIAPAVKGNMVAYEGGKEWGYYNHTTDEIYINVNATWSKANMMAFTLGHELAHRAKAGSPKQFKAFADFLVEQYGKQGASVNDMIIEQITAAERENRQLTTEEAFEEVVADACQRMLLDTDAGQKLAEWGAQSSQNKGFLAKLKQIITDLLNRLRSYFKGVDPDSLAAKEFAKIDANAKQLLADMFVDMSIDAGEKLSTIKEAGMSIKNTAIEGGKQYKLVAPFTDNNGVQYDSAVLLDTAFFDGLSPRNWGSKLRDFVKYRATMEPFILPILDENGNIQQLEFAKGTDRVYKSGKSQHDVLDELSTSSDNISKLAVIHIDEIIDSSEEDVPYYTSQDPIANHGWMDKNGWLHRIAYVINAKNGGIYRLVVDVAKADDGRHIMYATKGKINRVGTVQVNSLKPRGSGHNSNSNGRIAQTDPEVKRKDLEYQYAVSRGDLQTAQRMVMEAGAEAGFDQQMFHETDAENIHIFDISRGDHGGTDYQTPYGIFTKSSSRNIGLGSKQMALLVKAHNTLRVENREDVVSKIPGFAKYYDQIQAIDQKYDAISNRLEDEELDALWEWMQEHPEADMDVVFPSSYIIEGKPADIDDPKYLEAHEKYMKNRTEWETAYGAVAKEAKSYITNYLRSHNYDSMYFAVDGGSRGRQTDSLIVLDENQVKSAEPVTYDDKGNVIPLSERFNPAKKDIRYKVPVAEDLSPRELLLNTVEGMVANDTEYKKLQEYRRKIQELNETEKHLERLNEQLRQLYFAEGGRDYEMINKLEGQRAEALTKLNRYDSQLINLENTKPIRDIVNRMKQAAYQRGFQKAKAHYKQKADAREESLKQHYQESRRNAVERHDKAQIRQQIRKDVQRLDSLLNKGNKQKHVKQELQAFAGAALRTAKGTFLKNYNEYDMVRNGITGTMSREHQQILKRCQELLTELDELRDEIDQEPGADNLHDKWDPEAALRRDDRVEALKKELAKNMAILRDADIFKVENELMEDSNSDQLMTELLATYKALQESESAHVRGIYSQVIYDQMDGVRKFLAGKAVKDMTTVELKELQKMYRLVLHTITTSNELFAQKRKADVRKLGEEVIRQLQDPGKAMTPEILDRLKKMGWANLKPETALELIGSDTLTEMMQGLYRGEDTYALDIDHARKFAQEQAQKYGRKNWDMEKSMPFAGTKITLGQAMSLYAYTKRQQAQGHLEGDGFTSAANVRIKEALGKLPVKLKYIMNATKTHKVSKDMYAKVEDLLTHQQKKYAEAMMEYLTKVMGAKGNEVSMQLYGIELFQEKAYFPIKTAAEYHDEALGATSGEVKLKNTGFTNKVQEGASNPIVLDDFERIWAGHVDKMSLYHGFVLPMEDFDRVYNYHLTAEREVTDAAGEIYKTELVDTNETVKVDIENKVGKAANEYIEQFMQQLNGGVRGDSTEKLFGGMVRNFKKTAVLGSLSVAIQQPTAFVRAMAYLDVRDIADWRNWLGKSGKPEGKIVEEMYKYAPVALMKKIGGFDPGLGRTSQDYIFENKEGVVSKLENALGMLPEKMDEWTWTYIWLCSKRQIHRQHPDLRVGSKEFCEKAGELFSKIIRDTQVYDSVLVKTQIMRSKNLFLQMATSFLNEPSTSLDMYIRSAIQAKRGKIKGKQLARVYGSVVGSQILCAALAAFVYAARDDDEDETYLEKYLNAALSKSLENMLPWYSIPFVKDIISIFEGYDVERSDMSIVTDIYQGWQKLQNDKATPWEKVEAFGGSILNLFGIPLKNLSRDVRGIYNTIDHVVNPRTTATKAGLRYAAKEGLTGKGTPKTEQMYNAVCENDAAHILRLMATYDSGDSAQAAVCDAVKSSYIDGKITEEWALDMLQVYGGVEQEDAQEKVLFYEFKKQYPESDLNQSAALNWYSELQSTGISLEIYTEYCTKKRGYTKKADIMEVIDSLDLTKHQKDALYYGAGYAESTIDEAPWH